MMPSTTPIGLGIRIVEIPSEVQHNPNAGIYIVSRLLPGSTYSQRIEVSNTTNLPMNVTIYPGAATNSLGIFSASPPGVTNELTSWTSVTPESGVIKAHGLLTAIVTIKVPTVVAPSEEYGAIWAATASKLNAAGIVNVNRVGIRMYDPVGNYSASTTSTTASAHPSWMHTHQVELQWFAIGALALLALALLIFRSKRWKKAAKRRRKNQLKTK